MTRRWIPALALLAVLACERVPEEEPAAADRPPRPDGWIRVSGVLTTTDGAVPYRAVWAHRDGTYAGFVVVDGLARWLVTDGERGWERMGAAVADLRDPAREADVLGAILFEEDGSIAPEGKNLRRRSGGTDWDVVVRESGDDLAATPEVVFERPAVDGPAEWGPFDREEVPAGNRVVVTCRGSWLDLARSDRFLAHAVEVSRATRRGPLVRTILSYPDPDGVLEVRTHRRVGLSRDPDAKDLPRGARVEAVSAYPVLAATFTGPFPREDSDFDPLRAEARRRDLAAAGPVEIVVLSDPDEAPPNRQRLKLRLPVEEKR